MTLRPGLLESRVCYLSTWSIHRCAPFSAQLKFHYQLIRHLKFISAKMLFKFMEKMKVYSTILFETNLLRVHENEISAIMSLMVQGTLFLLSSTSPGPRILI